MGPSNSTNAKNSRANETSLWRGNRQLTEKQTKFDLLWWFIFIDNTCVVNNLHLHKISFFYFQSSFQNSAFSFKAIAIKGTKYSSSSGKLVIFNLIGSLVSFQDKTRLDRKLNLIKLFIAIFYKTIFWPYRHSIESIEWGVARIKVYVLQQVYGKCLRFIYKIKDKFTS